MQRREKLSSVQACMRTAMHAERLLTPAPPYPEGHPCCEAKRVGLLSNLISFYPTTPKQLLFLWLMVDSYLNTTSQFYLSLYWLFPPSETGSITTGKPVSHERKSTLTPTQRESVSAKSPVSGGDPLGSHSPFDPHHRPVVPGEVYRTHLPPHLDPAIAFHHRVLDPGNLRHYGTFLGVDYSILDSVRTFL